MNILLLDVPWPEASGESSTTLSLFMASAHSSKEEALTFVVSVVRDNCRSWPHRGRAGPQVRRGRWIATLGHVSCCPTSVSARCIPSSQCTLPASVVVVLTRAARSVLGFVVAEGVFQQAVSSVAR